MTIGNAGQYGAMAVYYGGSAAPYTRWPVLQGGDLNGVNAFMLGKNVYGTLPPRPVGAYANASITGVFSTRLSGGGTMVPCRIGPMAAFIDTSGTYGFVW